MQNVFIGKGHGYESGHESGRCTAFDGFEIVAHPLPGRDDRSFDGPRGGVTYGSFNIQLAKKPRSENLYILMHHGGGREVLEIPDFYDGGELKAHILAMPERLQYALLMTLYKTARDAREQGAGETRATWAQAFADGRIRKKRATKTRGPRVEIVPQWEIDLKKAKAAQ